MNDGVLVALGLLVVERVDHHLIRLASVFVSEWTSAALSRAPSDGPCFKFMVAHHSIHWPFVYRPKPSSGSPSIQANHSSVVCWCHRSL